MLMQKLNRIMEVPEDKAELYLSNGYKPFEPQGDGMDDETEGEENELRDILNGMTDEEILSFATERGIQIPDNITRRDTIIARILRELGLDG